MALAAIGGFAIGIVSLPSARTAIMVAAGPSPADRAASPPPQDMISHCYAVDGDTLRCGAERIRLIGIDSPEMPGHCRTGRKCVSGDPHAAKAALSGAVAVDMGIRRFGTDHYGRTLALVRGPLGDLSCAQVRGGHAIYRADWDVDGAMMKACG